MFGSAVARIKDALTDDPHSQSLSEYRAFRARLIARDAVQRRIEEAWAEASAVADPWTRRPLPKKGLAYGRHVIRALRIEALAVLRKACAAPVGKLFASVHACDEDISRHPWHVHAARMVAPCCSWLACDRHTGRPPIGIQKLRADHDGQPT
jgi:hypothetical protein